MAKIDIYDLKKNKTGTMDLSPAVFEQKVNYPLVHQVLKAFLASQRQGTAKTKTKSEVRGGGKKPFKQKGTGNARQGSTRSSLNVGGGQNFGPTPRDYSQATPKEMVRGALRSVLSDRLSSGRVIVLGDFSMPKVSTKQANAVLTGVFSLPSALIVDERNENLFLSTRNTPTFRTAEASRLNVYEIVKAEWLVLTKSAVESLNQRLSE